MKALYDAEHPHRSNTILVIFGVVQIRKVNWATIENMLGSHQHLEKGASARETLAAE